MKRTFSENIQKLKQEEFEDVQALRVNGLLSFVRTMSIIKNTLIKFIYSWDLQQRKNFKRLNFKRFFKRSHFVRYTYFSSCAMAAICSTRS
jgi:hypothetical protein